MPFLRRDLIISTALTPASGLEERAQSLAAELGAPFVPRGDESLAHLFAQTSGADRALLVQTRRLLLVSRDGQELFYHPNMAFLRLGNLLRGGRDLLIEAAALQPGDRVLDATLGYASEAILCAYAVGECGVVHGIEAVPELGILVREGLQTVVTRQKNLNALMRRIEVVHLGHHREYLRACPTGSYDVICFDPFFEEALPDSAVNYTPLRAFGDHTPLLPDVLAEAQRVARRRVVVKTVRRGSTLADLGITDRYDSRGGKVTYGILRGSDG